MAIPHRESWGKVGISEWPDGKNLEFEVAVLKATTFLAVFSPMVRHIEGFLSIQASFALDVCRSLLLDKVYNGSHYCLCVRWSMARTQNLPLYYPLPLGDKRGGKCVILKSSQSPCSL